MTDLIARVYYIKGHEIILGELWNDAWSYNFISKLIDVSNAFKFGYKKSYQSICIIKIRKTNLHWKKI